jgi:methylthioribose-1-phosphate isomerase
MPMPVETMRCAGTVLELIDQRLLPFETQYVRCHDAREAAAAITSMVVRGAPAIGCAAAYGLAIEAAKISALPSGERTAKMADASRILRASRPTAINLFWAVDRMERIFGELNAADGPAVAKRLFDEAARIFAEDLETNRSIGRHGAAVIPDGARIMTHCNAGALATAGHGTALGVIRSARDHGKRVTVIANETRPYLQGARLTAWEMVQEEIPVTLVTDNMAGHLMQQGEVDVILLGADRVAANGDCANKIGTYTLAVLAARHQIPFYVAAPLSTIDLQTATGAGIPIEERAATEVTGYRDLRWAPEGVTVRNPAFDVTPADLVTGLITERGVMTHPNAEKIRGLFRL